MRACRNVFFSVKSTNEKGKKHSTRLMKSANKLYSKLQYCISQHLYSSSINTSVKRRLGVGVSFFPTFFTILYWEIDSFYSKKVSFGSHERKIILKKLWSKWKCACNKLLSVGSFSRKNGHVVNHSRVFLSWRWPNRKDAVLVRKQCS